jgi:hypothetical protein
MNDSTGDYFVLINEMLLNFASFTDNNNNNLIFSLCIFRIHFQLLLVGIPYENVDTYSWIIHKRTVKRSICVNTICTLAETKIGSLVYSNSPPSGTVVIRILRFFAASYLLFLPSHRYRTKQNRSCQLLFKVRMQYGCFTQCQKRIKSSISFKVSVLLAEL